MPIRARAGFSFKRTKSEEQEQKDLAKWCRARGLLFTHIANEVKDNDPRFGAKLKAMGKSAGVPDMLIFLDDGLLAIELKKAEKKGTKVSDAQKQWIENLNKLSWARAYVCYGAEQAIKLIQECLNAKK